MADTAFFTALAADAARVTELAAIAAYPQIGRGDEKAADQVAVDAMRTALNALPMAMTAHVVYTALDPDRPATTSPRIILEIIRGEIGFDGLLMSDDVSMKALSGDFDEKSRAILAAGCDVVLHCNGVMDEMQAVAKGVGALTPEAVSRAGRAMSLLGRADGADEMSLREEFTALTGAIA